MRTVRRAGVRLAAAAALAGVLATPATTLASAADHCQGSATPSFQHGFADLKQAVGDPMGNPATCEYPDPKGTGDVEQNTSTGLAFWRKSTNTPTFTDGYNHWALTADGLVAWTGDSIDPPADATSATSSSAGPAPTPPPSPEQALSFGPVALFKTALGSVPAVLVTNTGSSSVTFTAKAVFQQNGSTAATFEGAVNDLAPGQARAAVLYGGQSIPGGATPNVQVDALSSGRDWRPAFAFGQPSPDPTSGMITLSVTNKDTATHTLTVQVAYLKGGALIGVAEGAMSRLGAGQTRTATLVLDGTTAGADQTLVAATSVL